MVTPEPPPAAALERLRAELAGRGLTAAIDPAGDGPLLEVLHPGTLAGARLFLDDGFFWESFAERVAADDDIGAAAAEVARHLSPQPDGNGGERHAGA